MGFSQLRADMAAFRDYIQSERGLAENTVLAYGRDLDRYARWVDPTAGRLARPGELLWFIRAGDKEEEVADGTPIIVRGRPIRPQSRTFFRAGLTDNPVLAATDYASLIEAMPDGLRAVLQGDFGVSRRDDPWQVIPTEWVRAAQ